MPTIIRKFVSFTKSKDITVEITDNGHAILIETFKNGTEGIPRGGKINNMKRYIKYLLKNNYTEVKV